MPERSEVQHDPIDQLSTTVGQQLSYILRHRTSLFADEILDRPMSFQFTPKGQAFDVSYREEVGPDIEALEDSQSWYLKRKSMGDSRYDEDIEEFNRQKKEAPFRTAEITVRQQGQKDLRVSSKRSQESLEDLHISKGSSYIDLYQLRSGEWRILNAINNSEKKGLSTEEQISLLSEASSMALQLERPLGIVLKKAATDEYARRTSMNRQLRQASRHGNAYARARLAENQNQEAQSEDLLKEVLESEKSSTEVSKMFLAQKQKGIGEFAKKLGRGVATPFVFAADVAKNYAQTFDGVGESIFSLFAGGGAGALLVWQAPHLGEIVVDTGGVGLIFIAAAVVLAGRVVLGVGSGIGQSVVEWRSVKDRLYTRKNIHQGSY